VGPRAGLDDVEKEKFFTLPGLKLRTLGRPARSHSLYRLSYSGFNIDITANKLWVAVHVIEYLFVFSIIQVKNKILQKENDLKLKACVCCCAPKGQWPYSLPSGSCGYLILSSVGQIFSERAGIRRKSQHLKTDEVHLNYLKWLTTYNRVGTRPVTLQPVTRIGASLLTRSEENDDDDAKRFHPISFHHSLISSPGPGQSSGRCHLIFFLICALGFWVLRPLTGLLYQSRMIGDGDCGEIGGIKIGRGNRRTRRKPAPAPLCPSQIPHD
jgi:hypothetical protein